MRLMINGLIWDIWFVPWDNNNLYMPHTNDYRLGMCDLDNQTICVRDDLDYETTKCVLQHELAHGISYSVGYPVDEYTDEILAQFSGYWSDEISEYASEIMDDL